MQNPYKKMSLKDLFISNWEWLILGFIGIFIFSSHMYSDFWETMRHGMVVWDALFDGKILDFYAYCGGNSGGIHCGSDLIGSNMEARYDFTIYIIFAIWNFPLWLIEHIRGGNIQNNFFAMLYAKSMLLVAIGITGYLIKKIVRLITNSYDNVPGLVLSYCSSCTLMASILIIGQYDILALIFILAGVYFYLRDNTRNFLICFIIANSMKYFALLYLVPLLCLKDKNPLKILGKLALSMSLSVAFKLLFTLGTYGSSVLSTNNDLLDILISYQIFSGVSLFWVSYIILVIYCYRSNNPSSSRHYQETIFAGFVTYALLYTSSPAFPYWIVLAIPFMTIMIHTSGRLYGINTFLAVLFEVSLLLNLYTRYSWCYSSVTFGNMLLYKIIPNKAVGALNLGGYLLDTYAKYPTWHIYDLLVTTFTAVGYAMMLINVPKETNQKYLTYSYRKAYLRIRMFICIFIALIPILYYTGVAHGLCKPVY